ncbi:MAG: BatD family protein [Bacteriovoracaceae bacterium]
MKCLILILALFHLSFAFADDVKIETNPPKPVVGETFQVYFRIFTESDEEPEINFSPAGVEVIGKSNQGISTRTVYANGKLTVSREMTFVYELVANRVGSASLREITVQIGNKVLRPATLYFNIIKEPEEMPEIFVMADVPKKEVFLGEGIVVRYYLYSRVLANNIDVKKYPKLNNFLKRFLQDADRSERVSVDGQIYIRNQIYAAKIFPEKIGELRVDSIQLSAMVPTVTRGDPFANFGLARDYRNKTLSSEPVKIIVKPLPTPIPVHFTGLIGKHDFEIQFGKNKLIVNEPLEVKLSVTGGGALENLEAPAIIKNPALEEFETNGDLKISNHDVATKTFDYTFLAKKNLNLPASNVVLSYFDPVANKYVPTTLSIPEITIAGGTAESERPSEELPTPSALKNETEIQNVPKKVQGLAGPALSEVQEYHRWLPYLNLSLAAIAFFIALGFFIKSPGFRFKQNGALIPSEFKKGQFSLSEFTRWISPIIQQTGRSPISIIRESTISEEAKSYFIDLLNSNDYKEYSASKTAMTFAYKAEYFKDLGRYIESLKNESSS